MPSPAPLSSFAAELRRYDRDRFVLSLFAPDAVRADLHALFAFNLEIARVRELVTEPMLGRIRIQWWRDMVEGLFNGADGADHPTAAELGQVIRRRQLSREALDALLDARELDLEAAPPADLAALEAYAAGTAASLQQLALEVLGAGENQAAREAARHVGIAWALCGLLRAYPYHAASGRLFLPFDLLDRHGVEVEDLLAGKPPRDKLALVARELADLAEDHLKQARALRRQVPKAALPALLAASLSESYLRRLAKAGYDLCDQIWSRPRPRPLYLAWRSWRGRY